MTALLSIDRVSKRFRGLLARIVVVYDELTCLDEAVSALSLAGHDPIGFTDTMAALRARPGTSTPAGGSRCAKRAQPGTRSAVTSASRLSFTR